MDAKQLYQHSFPCNHLLNVTLFEQNSREKYFILISGIPGEGVGNNRTYNFKNGSISLKYSLAELEGLSFALTELAKGNINILPYVKFSNSKGVSKFLSLFQSTEKDKHNNTIRYINININAGTNKMGIRLSLDQAHSMGAILNKIFERGMMLSINNFVPYSHSNNQPDHSVPSESFQDQMQNNGNFGGIQTPFVTDSGDAPF